MSTEAQRRSTERLVDPEKEPQSTKEVTADDRALGVGPPDDLHRPRILLFRVN